MTLPRPLTLTLLLVGCGGSGAIAPDTDEVFRDIQVQEAIIAHRTRDADICRGRADCPAELELCAAVDQLCRLSQSIDDQDATARCRSARHQCPRTP